MWKYCLEFLRDEEVYTLSAAFQLKVRFPVFFSKRNPLESSENSNLLTTCVPLRLEIGREISQELYFAFLMTETNADFEILTIAHLENQTNDFPEKILLAQTLIYLPGCRKDRLFAGLSSFNFSSYNLKYKSSGKLTCRDGKDI